MNGIMIEYLLGIYFLVVSMSWTPTPAPSFGGRVQIDQVKFIAAVILLVMAFLSMSMVK